MEEIGIVPADTHASSSNSRGSFGASKPKDVYYHYKKLQQQLEFLTTMEEYVKDEQRNLKRELVRAQEEVCLLYTSPSPRD